jgi:hypothetical protein
MDWKLVFVYLWINCVLISLSVTNDLPEAWFPLQFSGNLEITSHLLPEDSDYPPQKRRMTIYYDYINKRARADIEAGYEAAKYYIRRYDEKNEYMIRLPPLNDCKRSYLGETMPFPEIPQSTKFIGFEEVNEEDAFYFIFNEFDIRVHIYMSLEGAPMRLIQERIDDETGLSIPLLTYEFSDVSLEAPDISWFELPEEFDHKSCLRHVGGFPYLHVFHYFVKF